MCADKMDGAFSRRHCTSDVHIYGSDGSQQDRMLAAATARSDVPAATAADPVSSRDPRTPFQRKVDHFVARQGDALDFLRCHSSKENDTHVTKPRMYGTPPPLEYHMLVDSFYRKERALQLMLPGQVLEGCVTRCHSNGLGIELTALMPSAMAINRELGDLRIEGLVKVENLARDPVKAKEALRDYQVDDVIRAVVMGIENNIVQLSFLSDDKDLKLGYIDCDPPSNPRLPKSNDYIEMLTSSTGFKNPSCIDNLKCALGVPSGSHAGLLRPILMTSIEEREYCDSLRKSQRSKWSMDTVASGVKCFKLYQYEEALKFFNYALEIDAQNVEALVARGALYANKGRYEKAISDFESALTINHTHSNAKKYLVETQTAYGRELERQGDIKQALRCYREALADNPSSEPAKTRAALLTTVLDKQAAERKEKERKRREEEHRLKKLRKIIERESHHKKHKRKKSKKRRHDSSSSSDDSPHNYSPSHSHKH